LAFAAKRLTLRSRPNEAAPNREESMDHVAAVKKYAPQASDETIAKIVKHLGIALRNRDSSLVAASDPDELKTVHDSWCKRKLGLTDDAAITEGIRKVAEKMKGDHDKSRVAFYYLLGEHFGLLHTL
jgi:hypothetical protein